MELASKVHMYSRRFPVDERYGLTAQIRSCSVSIPSNIAEGSQRTTSKDFAHFLRIARGSWAELKTQLILAKNFGYLPEDQFEELMRLADSIGKMMYGLHAKLTTAHRPPTT